MLRYFQRLSSVGTSGCARSNANAVGEGMSITSSSGGGILSNGRSLARRGYVSRGNAGDFAGRDVVTSRGCGRRSNRGDCIRTASHFIRSHTKMIILTISPSSSVGRISIIRRVRIIVVRDAIQKSPLSGRF